MKLENKHILLRAPEPEDLELLYNWENDTKTWQVSNTVTPFSKFILRQYLETAGKDIFEARQLRLMIDLKKDKSSETIGTIDLFDFDPLHLRAGVGILIASEKNRRKGHATQSLDLLIQYAFGTLHLHQLFCNILEDNLASIALFQKAGFEIIGIKKDWVRSGADWQDEYLLQMINLDLQP